MERCAFRFSCHFFGSHNQDVVRLLRTRRVLGPTVLNSSKARFMGFEGDDVLQPSDITHHGFNPGAVHSMQYLKGVTQLVCFHLSWWWPPFHICRGTCACLWGKHSFSNLASFVQDTPLNPVEFTIDRFCSVWTYVFTCGPLASMPCRRSAADWGSAQVHPPLCPVLMQAPGNV